MSGAANSARKPCCAGNLGDNVRHLLLARLEFLGDLRIVVGACSWFALSCPIPCSTFARSRAIVWSNCASSGAVGAAAGVTSCGAV